MSVHFIPRPLLRIVALAIVGLLSNHVFSAQYTLEEAVSKAQSEDPWITGSFKRQESLEAMSVASGSLPDPSVSIGIANVPIDSFDFSQEPMTQFKVGINQMFPRGKSLSLRQERLEKLSQMQPFARENRRAEVATTVAQLWLDVYRYESTIELIQNDRALFEHLVDVAESSYTTASGKTRQQDLVRAQLELTRLDDRLTQLHQQRDMHLSRLSEWLVDTHISLKMPSHNILLIDLAHADIVGAEFSASRLANLAKMLNAHPKIKQIDQKVSAFTSNIKLTQQSYKPQWGLNASYGYRDQTPMGDDRADFVSLGVTLDVPLFTKNRQDKEVQSAIAEQEFVKTERALTLRQLKSGFETAEAQYLRLIERQTLFDTRLLNEMAEQADASLSAYTHDDGDFAEVVRARIAELNARIEALNVTIDTLKTIAQINYFQTGYDVKDELVSIGILDRAEFDVNAATGDNNE